MKKISLLAIALLVTVCSYAQNNMATTYCAHNDLNASRFEPSELDLGEKRFQIGFNYYLWAGNTSITYADIQQITNPDNGVIQFNDLYDKIKENNLFGVGQDVQLFGLAYQLRSGDKKYDFSLSVVDRFGTSMNFPETTLKLIMKGNAQFAGETVNVGGFGVNTQYMREVAAGFAIPLFGNNGREEGFGVRIGGRLKYLLGVGAIRTVKSDAYMTTAADGTSIEIDFDYELQTAGLTPSEFSFFKKNGSGIGVDLGAAFFFGENIEVNASIMDIGAVRYTKDINSYKKSGNYVYEGAIVSELFGDVAFEDSVDYIFQPDQSTEREMVMPLGTKLLIQGEFKTPRLGNKDKEYVSNAIFFTYVQGIGNLPGATTRPYFSVAYNHDFHKILDAGLMASYGGYNQVGVGAFFSLNIANTVKFGFGTDNLLPIFAPNMGTGIDGSFNMSIAF